MILVLLFVLSACSILGNDDQQQAAEVNLGSDTTLSGQAHLVCSQECGDRGQCGTAQEGVMVLLNSSMPVTSGHDMAIPQGTAVNIDHNEARPVIQDSDQQLMTVVYYQVDVPNRGFAWTAGWCIAQ
jgi:hypothetical protein